MKFARFAYNGKVYDGEYRDDRLYVGTQSFDPADVMWLPPVDVNGITALGVALGYADHAEELGLELPEYPIMFHKMGHTLIGHDSKVVKPDVEYMHYEGELVVIMGRSAYKVRKEDALDYVKGYTIANEYTVRDFVTNYYRPPVKAKGFHTFGPIGPVWVTPDEIDPENTRVITRVNGEVRQDGNTKHLRHSAADLIEWLSDFMVLNPGDVIFTGTPKGISHVYAGDTVEVEIAEIGVLRNTIVESL